MRGPLTVQGALGETQKLEGSLGKVEVTFPILGWWRPTLAARTVRLPLPDLGHFYRSVFLKNFYWSIVDLQ